MTTNDRPPLADRIEDYMTNTVDRLLAERDALINTAIVPTGAVFVWHLGSHGGHKPTWELARAAVLRVAGVKESTT